MAAASAGGPVREVVPACRAAVGEHQAGAGQDGKDEEAGAVKTIRGVRVA